MQFEIPADDMDTIRVWDNEQNDKVYQKQIAIGGNEGQMARERGKAYYGASGGHLTYSFTPTGLGMCLEVEHASGDKLDLTHYEDW